MQSADDTCSSTPSASQSRMSNRVRMRDDQLTFSYSALPRPRFSRSGRYVTCIPNNSCDRVNLIEINYSDDNEEDGDGDDWGGEPIPFILKGGEIFSLTLSK